MPLGNKKFDCGDAPASSCIPYTGKDLTFLVAPDKLSCDASIDDVFGKIDVALKSLLDSNDFKSLQTNCLSFTPATVTAKALHQLEINEICLLKGQVQALTTQLNSLNIGTEVITINLGCLAASAAPCVVAPNQYQLISILTLFVNKLCELETRISNLES